MKPINSGTNTEAAAPKAPEAPKAPAAPKMHSPKMHSPKAASSAQAATPTKPAGAGAFKQPSMTKAGIDEKKPENVLDYSKINPKPHRDEPSNVLDYSKIKSATKPFAMDEKAKALKSKIFKKQSIQKADASMISSNISLASEIGKKQGVPEGVDPDKHERCVKEVKAKGRSKSSAFAICNASMSKSETTQEIRELIKKEIYSPFIPKFTKWDSFAKTFPEFVKNDILLLSKAIVSLGTPESVQLAKAVAVFALPLTDKKNKAPETLKTSPEKTSKMDGVVNPGLPVPGSPRPAIETPVFSSQPALIRSSASDIKDMIKEDWSPKFYQKKEISAYSNPLNPEQSVDSDSKEQDHKEFPEEEHDPRMIHGRDEYTSIHGSKVVIANRKKNKQK